MDQAQRKAWIIQQLESGRFESIHEAWPVVRGEFESLEGIPFGVRTKPNHIFTDIMDNRITGDQSIHLLVEAVRSIPD